jgi:hypothetical protein
LNSRRKFTPPALARLWGISPEKVLNWIRSGELAAINAATTAAGRPRFLIDVAAVKEFEERRSVRCAPKLRRRQRSQRDVIQFF